MLSLKEQLVTGYAVKAGGVVCIKIGTKQYFRKIYYKYFSNHPIEYIVWNNRHHSVNTIQEGLVFQST